MANFNLRLNEKFTNEVISLPSYLLDSTVDWVAENLDPGDVFDDKQLELWAYDNGFKKFE